MAAPVHSTIVALPAHCAGTRAACDQRGQQCRQCAACGGETDQMGWFFNTGNSKSKEEELTGSSGSLGKTMNSVFALFQRRDLQRKMALMVGEDKWKPKKMILARDSYI
jgi:hypothetical protein